MTARSASWPARLPEARRGAALRAAALGAVLFALTFGLLNVGPLGRDQIVDTPLYQRFGEAMLAGAVPYRDVVVEYPPGALPAFLLPSLGPAEHYKTLFELEMALCGVAAVLLSVLALARAGAAPARMYAAAAFMGIAPLALGTVVLTRFDLWPAALTAGAIAALVSGRPRLGLGVLAVAVAAKAYPAVVLPVALALIWRRHGPRQALLALAVFVAVLAAMLVPFAILGPEGLWDAIARQSSRPLQIESLGASLLVAGDQLGLVETHVVSSFGSQNLDGGLPDGVATAVTVLQVLAVVGVWALAWRSRGGPDALFAGSAAAVAAFVAFGKVLSPQFLVWLVPLVPLVAGGSGIAASGLLALALLMTQLWFPRDYWDLVALQGREVWLVLGRDLVLVAMTAVLAAAIRRRPGRSRSA